MTASYVYVLEAFDKNGEPLPICKVGKSNIPPDRVKGLSTGCPYRLELRAAWAFEDAKQAHKNEMLSKWRLKSHRMKGEWYSLPGAEIQASLTNLFLISPLHEANY